VQREQAKYGAPLLGEEQKQESRKRTAQEMQHYRPPPLMHAKVSAVSREQQLHMIAASRSDAQKQLQHHMHQQRQYQLKVAQGTHVDAAANINGRMSM